MHKVAFKPRESGVEVLLSLSGPTKFEVARNENSLSLLLANVEADELDMGDPRYPISGITLQEGKEGLELQCALEGNVTHRVRQLDGNDGSIISLVLTANASPVAATDSASSAVAKNQDSKPVGQSRTAQSSSGVSVSSVSTPSAKAPSAKVSQPKSAERSVKQAKAPSVAQLDRRAAATASRLFRSGSIVKAEQVLVDFLSSSNRAPESGRLLVSMYLEQGDFAKAAHWLSILREELPADIELACTARSLLSGSGQCEGSAGCFTEFAAQCDELQRLLCFARCSCAES